MQVDVVDSCAMPFQVSLKIGHNSMDMSGEAQFAQLMLDLSKLWFVAIKAEDDQELQQAIDNCTKRIEIQDQTIRAAVKADSPSP